jgi:hypothetical protein
MLGRGLPKGWVLVVLLNRGLEFRRQRQLVATAEAGGKPPVGCPAWHDRAVVVPVVPVAADSVTPSAHVRLKGCRTF